MEETLKLRTEGELVLVCPDTGIQVDSDRGATVPNSSWWQRRVRSGQAFDLEAEEKARKLAAAEAPDLAAELEEAIEANEYLHAVVAEGEKALAEANERRDIAVAEGEKALADANQALKLANDQIASLQAELKAERKKAKGK